MARRTDDKVRALWEKLKKQAEKQNDRACLLAKMKVADKAYENLGCLPPTSRSTFVVNATVTAAAAFMATKYFGF